MDPPLKITLPAEFVERSTARYGHCIVQHVLQYAQIKWHKRLLIIVNKSVARLSTRVRAGDVLTVYARPKGVKPNNLAR
jgi:hypothetical protein